jgi:ribosomal protein S18 acetylase RimI-like enzyme
MRRLMPRLRTYLGFHLLRVLVMPLDAVPPIRPEHLSLRYAALTQADLASWCREPDLELDEERALAALRRGDLCIGVTENGARVGYIWFAFGRAPHIDGAWVQFGSRTRYLYKAFVRPSYRGRRISAELYSRASEICPRRGKTLGVLVVDVDNIKSLRASTRAGWIQVGYAGFMRFLGLLFPFRSLGTRSFGLRFGGPPESRS